MKSDKIYLVHILDSIEAILTFTQGMTSDEFGSNRLVKDAVIRNFEIIGEAAKRVSESTKTNHPSIPWTKMAGLRDKLIHDYIKVNILLVWDVVVDILPSQKEQIKHIISSIN